MFIDMEAGLRNYNLEESIIQFATFAGYTGFVRSGGL